MQRIACFLCCTVLSAASFQVKESAEAITIGGPDYELAVQRAGFGLKLTRGGSTVLEAPPQRGVGKLRSWRRDDGAILFEFDVLAGGATVMLAEGTPERGATLRVEVVPQTKAIRFTLWRFHVSGKAAPGFQIKLEPSGLWYGGGFQGWRAPQIFPLNQAQIKPRLFLAEGNTQGTPAWYTTSGVAVWVRTPQDFLYSINDGGNGLLTVEMPGASSLVWDVLVEANIREAAHRLIRMIGLPKTVPPDEYFRLPIYTTWVEHKTEVSQEKVLEYARAIRQNDLPCGVIEIDDKWESRYGDMEFDAKKFPSPGTMVSELHKMGFRVTLWVHPFVNADSKTYADARMKPLFLADRNGRPGLIRWWQGIAAVWDFTNPKAAVEFRSRLTRLQKLYGFDGFKFDGGDANLVPQDLLAYKNITPAEYCDIYNREATAHFAWEETRVGVLSQPTGVVQRLIDKHSTWGIDNGFAAILPEAITVSMRGFAYVMPDMIGGNEYDKDRIDKELLIRWAQASALMPLMQFSKGPWRFGEEAVRLSREASRLHVRFAPYIIALAKEFPRTGRPILRPLWYEYPDDEACGKIMDQFMVGSDLVVAPVLEKGATKRKLYLPAGDWKNVQTGETHRGGAWIEIAAPLNALPLFVRQGSEAAKY